MAKINLMIQPHGNNMKWQYNTNNTQYNSVAACLGRNYDSNKEVRSSSSKFCFNIDRLEYKQVSTIIIHCFDILQYYYHFHDDTK